AGRCTEHLPATTARHESAPESSQEPSMSDEPGGDATTKDVPDSGVDQMDDDGYDEPLIAEPRHPINWNLLRCGGAEAERSEPHRWVAWLRHSGGLPACAIPRAWRMHPELLWERSALRHHWLCTYHPYQNGGAPHGWHRDLADARQRLREWVAA